MPELLLMKTVRDLKINVTIACYEAMTWKTWIVLSRFSSYAHCKWVFSNEQLAQVHKLMRSRLHFPSHLLISNF